MKAPKSIKDVPLAIERKSSLIRRFAYSKSTERELAREKLQK